MKTVFRLLILVVLTLPAIAFSEDAESEADLAKKLANPVASLISVPFQYNYDENVGPNDDGSISRLNIQPVIPFSLSDDWNLISRTILPVIDQNNIAPGVGDESGTGDTLQSFFFSPKEPVAGKYIVAAGPVLLIPTASDEKLGGEQWGLGPTGVILTQQGPWTFGALANHIWSVAGTDNRDDVNSTFIQPFTSYITETKTTFTLNTEATYDHESDQWAIPVNATVSQLLKVGPQILQVGAGPRYWAESFDNGPGGWGFRVQLTLLFPK